MKVHGSAELSRMLMLQRQVVDARGALDRAAYEMTTSEKADKVKATGGNLARLFSIERTLQKIEVYRQTLSVTEMRLDIMQEGLGGAIATTEAIAVDLITSTGIGDINASRIHGETAKKAFADTVAMLNTAVAGQSIFAGTATDRPALAPAEAMLADIAALAGAGPAAAAIAAVEAYFTPPAGGFFAGGYLGAAEDLGGAEIGEGVRLAYGVRADDPALVAVLKGHALAAVATGGPLAADPEAQMAIFAEAGAQLLAAREGMHELRGRVGVSQFAVETAKAQRTAEQGTYELARAGIVGADPYEAASRYQAHLAQLEALFTVTARLASLRFVNFMR